MEKTFLKICSLYGLSGRLKQYSFVKTGNINDTYVMTLLEDGVDKSYIVQRINHRVFKKPREVMKNIEAVTGHIYGKLKDSGESDIIRKVVKVYHQSDGNTLYVDGDGNYWRVTSFVFNSKSFDIPNRKILRGTGEGFGKFQALLFDFDASSLFETIPNFHNTAHRFEQLREAILSNPCGRVEKVMPEIEYVTKREQFSSRFNDLFARNEIPLRVTHNDTKCNNIMFDANSEEPLAVIDLDTVMPGFAMNDFGDALRFAANTAVEDEEDVSKVALNLDLYEAFVEGFIPPIRDRLYAKELENMNWGLYLMTLELSVRFLTDYINGDTYFKTEYPEHNLVRTRCQLTLLKDIEQKFDKIEKIIRAYIRCDSQLQNVKNAHNA